jgi:hypothetical protein
VPFVVQLRTALALSNNIGLMKVLEFYTERMQGPAVAEVVCIR